METYYVRHPQWGTMDQILALSAKKACAQYMSVHREIRREYSSIMAVDGSGRVSRYRWRAR
jgi:hypothetical protein